MEKYVPDDDFPVNGKSCPQCREKITPADVEMFPSCPYCGKLFKDSKKMEDYILKRKVREWCISHYKRFLHER